MDNNQYSLQKLDSKHIALDRTSNVFEICKHFHSSNITDYFYLIRVFDDGGMFSLNHAAEATRHYFNEGYHNSTISSLLTPGYHFWDESYMKTPLTRELRDDYNFDNRFEITTRETGFHDVLGFATHSQKPNALPTYLSNIDQLIQFGYYFKDCAKELIKIASRKKNRIPSKPIANLSSITEKIISPKADLYAVVSMHGDEVYLTSREMTVIKGFLLGSSARIIANELKISQKTVESHFENIKNKLGCSSRQDVFKNIWSSSLAEIILNEAKK